MSVDQVRKPTTFIIFFFWKAECVTTLQKKFLTNLQYLDDNLKINLQEWISVMKLLSGIRGWCIQQHYICSLKWMRNMVLSLQDAPQPLWQPIFGIWMTKINLQECMSVMKLLFGVCGWWMQQYCIYSLKWRRNMVLSLQDVPHPLRQTQVRKTECNYAMEPVSYCFGELSVAAIISLFALKHALSISNLKTNSLPVI